MNAIWLLMGLLMLSYLGSFLVGGRTIRGIGLPSGAEYLVLGFLVGPAVLGILDRASLQLFEPFAQVGLGWLMLVIGITFGVSREGGPGGAVRRIRLLRLTGGFMTAVLAGSLVAAATWILLAWRAPLSPRDRLLVAGGVGSACAETTRDAVRWVALRHRAAGPVVDLVGELSESGALVPLVGVAALFATAPTATRALSLPWWGWLSAPLGVGIILGLMTALLLGRTLRISETWGVLLGMSLLAVGVSARLGMASLATMFALGVTLGTLSPHRRELSAMLEPTQRPVMLPALLLAGAHVDFGAAPYLPWVVALAIVARVAGMGVVGLGILAVSPPARPAGLRLGLGLLPAGALAVAIGLTFAMRFPGPVGDVVLATAAAIAIFGEFVGPVSLRSALTRVGETAPDPALTTPIPDESEVAT